MSDSDDDKTEEIAEQVDGEITADDEDDMVLTLDGDETEDSDE